jgi:pilus assembly protein CpaE
MSDAVRVVVIDPNARSNPGLVRQLEGLNEIDLVEVCASYQTALKRLATLMPDLAVIVSDHDQDDAVELMAKIAEGLPAVSILPAGEDHDAGMILRAVRAGAREFLPLPTQTLDLVEAVRRLNPKHAVEASSGPRGPRVIAVTGAAGGVGCTSISVNLATNLAKLSRRDTVIADFDLLLGSLEESLGVIPDNTLDAVVRNIDEMDPALLKRWLPRHACGLYMLPHPLTLEESAQLDPEGVRRVLTLLSETFDTVIIDTSKGLQSTDFLAFQAADVIIVVLQLNLNCTRNTVRLTNYLRSFEGFGEKIKLVVNRVNSPLSEISVKKAEELLKAPLKWQISNATKLFRPARNLGLPIDEIDGGAGSKVHQELLAIAQELMPYASEPPKAKKKLFSAFR